MEEDEDKDTRTLGWSRMMKMKANEEEDTCTLGLRKVPAPFQLTTTLE